MDYKDFKESTGYGTGGGLCGWNCRHTFIPFNPKTMSNNLKDYGLEENKEMYEKHQKQRYIERNVRKYKRRVNIIKKSIEDVSDEQAKNKLISDLNRNISNQRKWSKMYNKFCKRNDLKPQNDRLKV